MSSRRDKYKIRNFVFDIFMCVITGVIPWCIWIYVREQRRNR
jgi:hypothetical protein